MKPNFSTRFNIFNYTDYRFLLRDYYSLEKKRNRKFSFRGFALHAGVAASVYKDIIAGRRRLSMDIAKKYARAMGLNDKENRYFETIVQFVNSKTNEEKNACFTAMMRLRGNFMMKFMEAKQYEFYRTWYHSAIRELITLPDFREDYEWIAKRCAPRITAAQARKSIELMIKLGIMRRSEKERLELTDAVISTEYEMESFLLRNFHTEMLGLAKEALERFEPKEREISSLTLGVSNRCYERIKERMRTFKQELITMAVEDATPSQTVCQCNFQLFPLVETGKAGGDLK